MRPSALARLEAVLRRFLEDVPLSSGDGIVVAFSGGPDSLALLIGLVRAAPLFPLRVLAAHLDHELDPGSAGRAARARELARSLGVEFLAERGGVHLAGNSLEGAAREARYRFLERTRIAAGARFVATAHHRDDQAETVALRILLGSQIEGLAGIRPTLGPVLRPLLALTRDDLAAAVAETPWIPILDPTNSAMGRPRNRLRHAVLPNLADGVLVRARLAAVAEAARGANRAVDRRLLGLLDDSPPELAPSLSIAGMRALPQVLQRRALTLLHRIAGRALPPSQAAQDELLRQLAGGGPIACDCGRDIRWIAVLGRLRLAGPPEPCPPPFTYTFQMPARIHVAELAIDVEVRAAPVAQWMFAGSAWRAGMRLPPGAQIEVRSRRPGDRLHPLGAPGSRRLKDLLIDRKVPRASRARLPLLSVNGQVAWVPGLTIDQQFRLDRETEACVAEITPA